ncbi:MULTISPECIES: short-chain dehydrogenase/reductase [Streptomyces]|uniref:SDR family NAD(P)-dependent oxidoreductase n=2 Tax=Streptomyces rimosus subsp. rimosus TaxID=132474 RepID=L8ERJ8_STRR1|nr:MULTISPECIES: short-chain dehydrogenase/reductase [Streptomyces]KOG71311.1 short-chain dehydrogenase [Kitasatospora aureofaciens]MYT43004.1 SDR family NAD(P)-dependent oxidoreductase [Streptomyces sp. SID5471]KEF08920.1 short-chain dehydrogenase [Streptomyces rimosus]KEF16958.1 short-chain dehydrogenase [Streptomyces rimosus]KOT39190.1 short-chain dehydrogenase [Streptomyces sp. NRRL WC-3701]
MSHDLPLLGRTAVVTGAARGLGAHMARSLVRRGADVALLGLEEDELERVAAGLPGHAAHWPVDVTDEDAMDRAAALVQRRFGPPSVVVANAGVVAGGPFLDTDPAVWRRVVEVNLIGSAVTARAFLPALLSTRGYFLQVASLAALGPAPMLSAYCASKSGVETFAQVLRAELAHRGVGVGVGYLSWADTEMVRASDRRAAMRELRAHLPWPASKTYDAAPVADRLVRGIERRSAAVYAQPWLRAGQVVRAVLPGIVTEGSRRAFLRLAGRADLTATGLLGAGGRAAEAAGDIRG